MLDRVIKNKFEGYQPTNKEKSLTSVKKLRKKIQNEKNNKIKEFIDRIDQNEQTYLDLKKTYENHQDSVVFKNLDLIHKVLMHENETSHYLADIFL